MSPVEPAERAYSEHSLRRTPCIPPQMMHDTQMGQSPRATQTQTPQAMNRALEWSPDSGAERRRLSDS